VIKPRYAVIGDPIRDVTRKRCFVGGFKVKRYFSVLKAIRIYVLYRNVTELSTPDRYTYGNDRNRSTRFRTNI